MPSKRKRYNFFLSPEDPTGLANALVGLETMYKVFLIDLTADGFVLNCNEEISAAKITMSARSFKTYELESDVHLEIDAFNLKRALSCVGKSSDFVIFQLAADPDHISIAKADLGTWTLGLRDPSAESHIIAISEVLAAQHYDTSAEMIKEFGDVKSVLSSDDSDIVQFEAALHPTRGSSMTVKCRDQSAQFTQRLKAGVSNVLTPLTMKISGSYLIRLMRVASFVKGPISLRIVRTPAGADVFALRMSPPDGDFQLDLFLAPKISDE